MQVKQWMCYALMCGSLMFSSTVTFSEQVSQPLSQLEYDQQIADNIKIVNDTKKVLDEADPASPIHPEDQKQALCKRITAYRNIFNLSHDHPKLESAMTMKYVSQAFLDRQKQSFQSSGMTEAYFCGETQSNFVRN